MILISHVNQARNQVGHKIYCGRNFGGYKASPLGNQFKPKADDKPGSTLANYKKWLWTAMRKTDSPQSVELRRIHSIVVKAPGNVILTCWCHEATTCHCSVIRAALLWMDKQADPEPVCEEPFRNGPDTNF